MTGVQTCALPILQIETILSFLILMAFIYLLDLIALTRISSTGLNKVTRVVILILFLILEEKLLAFNKKQRHCFANKCPSSQGYGFSCGHVWMGELDCEES